MKLRSIAATALLLGSMLTLVPAIASAQSTGGFGNSGDNRDPFNRASSGDSSGLFKLLNEAQLNGFGKNASTSSERDAQISAETADFRTRQLQLLRDRNKKATPATVIAPK